MNLRLIQAIQYTQKFCLKLYHKLEIQNTVFDRLFRLPSDFFLVLDKSILDILYTISDKISIKNFVLYYTVLIVENTDKFKFLVKEKYKNNQK